MQSKVLIVSAEEDIHALAVLRALERLGCEAVVLNNSDFPTACRLTLNTANNTADSIVLEHDRIGAIDVNSLSGIWWRRPQRYDLAQIPHPSLREFAAKECSQAFLGALYTSKALFVNPVANSRHAVLKLVQLQIAKEVGLNIPRTLVTTNPRSAQDFYTESGRDCIYKGFVGSDFGFYETRPLVEEEDTSELWRLSFCPMIVQERVNGEYDLRITVVHDKVFAAKFDLEHTQHPVDSRVGNPPVEAVALPEMIERQVRELVAVLGLYYAAVDMRFSFEDGYTFFEVNPEGQFLWIEIEAGLPISDALASLLASGYSGLKRPRGYSLIDRNLISLVTPTQSRD